MKARRIALLSLAACLVSLSAHAAPTAAEAPAAQPVAAPAASGGGVSGLIIGGLSLIGGGLVAGVTGLVLARGVAVEDIETCDGNSVCRTESVVTDETAETAGVALGIVGVTAVTGGVVLLLVELALSNPPSDKAARHAPALAATADGIALSWAW
jgi:hypothetical protein